jgi:hypothetical protein
MAEIRFNYGDKFTQTSDSNTGIGSTIPAGKLDIAGGTSAGSLRVSGIATLSSYQGFVNTKLSTTENLIVEAGQSGSVSGEVVVGTGQTISVSTGATTGQGGIQSLKVYETFMPPVGGTADRPTDVKPGMVYYNKDFKTIEFWDGNFWKQVDNITQSGRAVLGGGRVDPSTKISEMQSYNIHTLGNATYFGNLTSAKQGVTGFGSRIRAIYGGGNTPSYLNHIDYGTFQSEGNTIDFGDMTGAFAYRAGSSSSTRGIFSTGYTGSANSNVIDYIQISTIGDAVDFGDATVANRSAKALASPTRFVQAGGYTSEYHKGMEFLTISSLGNTVSFGDLSNRVFGAEGVSNNIKGVFAGGRDHVNLFINNIDSITISSTGSVEDFGDLINTTTHSVGSSTNTRGVFCGGYAGSSPYTFIEVMSFITFNSAGNSIDFGDLIVGTDMAGGTSDSHGGLGGF